ncbi:MAG: class I tRNA ligase family protein, partial [Caldithrix sp.]|nr:class I tRNA ligase family protein [Caldithrix sp.]
LMNSSSDRLSIDGMNVADAKKRITRWLEEQGIGRYKVNYKLRDWLFSRQRYWGEPFPVMHNPDGTIVAVDENDLPIELPEMPEFRQQPSDVNDQTEPQPPLSGAPDSWKFVEKDGVIYTREFNTMPQWAGSCWYYLRFIDPHNKEQLIDPQKEKYWMPVDLYVGGAEHSVLHLLYARFWHKVLYDIGVVSTKEPFQKLVHQGMILGEIEMTLYLDKNDQPVSADVVDENGQHQQTGETLQMKKVTEDDVEKTGERFTLKGQPAIAIDARAYKMSKSRGNVINPDKIVEQYGADSLRLYEMFMGPLKDMKSWSMKGLEGVHRFINRSWRLIIDEEKDQLNREVVAEEPTREQLRILHNTIKKVTEDIEDMAFNTAISALMIFVNEVNKWSKRPVSILDPFVRLLNPFVPHVAEELWQKLGQKESLAYEAWPSYNEDYLKQTEIEIPVQINGKLRATIQVEAEIAADKQRLQDFTLTQEKVGKRLTEKAIKRIIVIPNKLVNIVLDDK